MKRILLSISAVLAAIAIQAMPVKPGIWRNITLADGTVVKAELVGDKHLTYWRTADGACYRQTPSAGVFSKVELSALQSEYDAVVAQKAAREKAILESARTSMPVKKVEGSKFQGKKKCLVILANFADTKFKPEHTLDLYKQIINGENYSDETLGFKGSVRDYFKAQSGGQFEIDFDVVGPVDLPKGYAGYGKNDASGRDQTALVYPMVEDAVNLAKDQVTDWKQYDWDGDGLVEEVFVLYAGHGQATYPQDPDLVWPHKSAIDPMTVADGVKVSVYACSCELGATEAIDGIGAFCHEFSHCMGLKDHYDINGRGYGTGFWDIMCFGCYNGNSFLPAEYNSYEKMFCGWKEPIVLNAEPQKIEGMKALAAGGDTYIFYNDGNENEYYMLENRQKTGWDVKLPGHGMLVFRVDSTDVGVWQTNKVNASPTHNYYELLRAGNSTSGAQTSDPFPGTSNIMTLNNTTSPSLCTWNGTYNTFGLSEITETNGVITFKVNKEGDIAQMKEDFETMGTTSASGAKGVRGRFCSWNFTKCGVTAPSSASACDDTYSVAMKKPSVIATAEPLSVVPFMVAVHFFNPSSTAAKFKVQYSLDGTTWEDLGEASVAAKEDVNESFKIKSLSGPAYYRVYQVGGSTTAKVYVDNIVFTYYKEEGGVEGDINGDGTVDVSDVTALINKILGTSDYTDEVCDINGDGVINVSDVTQLINQILQ